MSDSPKPRAVHDAHHKCEECKTTFGLQVKPAHFACNHRVCIRCREANDHVICRFCVSNKK